MPKEQLRIAKVDEWRRRRRSQVLLQLSEDNLVVVRVPSDSDTERCSLSPASGAAGLLVVASGAPTVTSLGLLMFVFFCGFNILEASQPSMVSRIAPPQARGAALGVYNTLQSLGLFAGGVAGGALVKAYGPQGLFGVCAGAIVLWLLVAWPMVAPARDGLPSAPKAA